MYKYYISNNWSERKAFEITFFLWQEEREASRMRVALDFHMIGKLFA